MTTLTMPSKVPSMYIIATMTAITSLRHEHFIAHLLAVTTLALKSLMSALETKVRLFIMIK